jgi:hypothetical protein
MVLYNFTMHPNPIGFYCRCGNCGAIGLTKPTLGEAQTAWDDGQLEWPKDKEVTSEEV